MANPFAVQPLGGLQSIQGIKQGMAGIAEGVQQNKAEEQRQQLMQRASEVFERGDPREIAQFSIQNPEMAETLQGAFGFSNEQTKPIVMNTYQQALANPDRAAEIMQQGIEQVTAAGGRPTNMTRDLQLLQQDPEAGLKNIEMGFAAAAPDVYDQFFGQQGEPTPAAVRAFEAKAAAAGLKPGTPEYQEAAKIDLGMVPRAGSSAVERIAADPRKTQQVAESEQTRAGAKAAGTQAIQKSGEAYDKLATVESMIPKYDRAIQLIEEGANTGVIAERFPDLSQEAVELRNVQNQLGLDVISSVTFGALSEKELQVAMQTALPMNLEGPELIDWLETKKRANRKLADYLSEAAQFLGKPGNTVADWMEKKRGKSGGSQEGQTVNWSDL